MSGVVLFEVPWAEVRWTTGLSSSFRTIATLEVSALCIRGITACSNCSCCTTLKSAGITALSANPLVVTAASRPTENSLSGLSRKTAISYQRVSTTGQAKEEKSGLDRQEEALQRWMEANPGYTLDRKVTATVSGAKAGRFEWFIQELQEGRQSAGTCLVVEKVSRFSREPIEDVLKTLLRLWDAGGAIAFCELGGKVLSGFAQDSGDVYVVVGAIQRARGEWLERQDRSLAASRKRRQNILDGNYSGAFYPRGERKLTDYPFWLDFFPTMNGGRGGFKLNKHAVWIEKIFRLALTMGANKIAAQLRKDGFKSIHPRGTKPSPLSPETVRYYLSNRAVLGEYQFRQGKTNAKVGDPILGVFPPVISSDLWRDVRNKIDARDTRQTAVSSKHIYNLFQGRTYCLNCGSLAGHRPQRGYLADGTARDYGYLRCRAGQRNNDACNINGKQVGVKYEEESILDMVQNFRWESLYNAKEHGEKVKAVEQDLITAEHLRNRLQQEWNELDKQIGSPDVTGATLKRFNDKFNAKDEELRKAKETVEYRSSKLAGLRQQKHGSEAVRIVQLRIKNFIETGRNDIEKRAEFNRWVHDEELVLGVDIERKKVLIGTGPVNEQNKLEYFDERMEDLVALGMDPTQAKVEMKKIYAKEAEQIKSKRGRSAKRRRQ